MNDRRQGTLDELLDLIPSGYRFLFTELAEYAVSLGYAPKRNKTKDVSIDFTNRKTKKTILKLEEKEQKHAGYRYGERGIPGIRMKYFAADTYSEIFSNGVKTVIEEFGGKYTGCYGCGDCGGALQGYRYRYPDGKMVFRCGRELISVFDFSDASLEEMKTLLKKQAEYFDGRLGKAQGAP